MQNANEIFCLDCENQIDTIEYEVTNNTYLCEECYTIRHHPDCITGEFECDNCGDDYNYYNGCERFCNHNICEDCYDTATKFNKCPICYAVLNEDAELDLTICNSCKHQNCDCICCYRFDVINILEVKGYAIWLKYNTTIPHQIIRWVTNNHFEYDIEDIDIIKVDGEASNIYEFITPSKKHRLEFYNETEFNTKISEVVSETLYEINTVILTENIKPNIYKKIIKNDNLETEPKKVFDSDGCPVCLSSYIKETDNITDVDYSDKVEHHIPVCGHMICKTCYNHIVNSHKCKCPTCRVSWAVKPSTEYVKWTNDDIEELCYDENNELLNEIIDIEGVVSMIAERYSYNSILNCDGIFIYHHTEYKNEILYDGFIVSYKLQI